MLTHLPFYCVLVPQLLALALARLSLQGDVAATELLLLLRALQASGPELLQELRSAERAYNRCARSGGCWEGERGMGRHAPVREPML